MMLVALSLAISGCALFGSDHHESLVGGEWRLLYEADSNGAGKTFPASEQIYSLTFDSEGTVRGQSDCNSCPGAYSISKGKEISIAMGCTEIACGSESRSDHFAEMVNRSHSFDIRSGELFLFAQDRFGVERTLVFRRAP
jgi:heat shock protein HslJ